MVFARMRLEDWGHAAVDWLPADILDRLGLETRQGVDDFDITTIALDPATEPGQSEFVRATAEIPLSAELFDAFFNSRGGYRAQYAVSTAAGEAFNRAAVDVLAAVLGPTEQRYVGGLDRSTFEASMAGAHAKIWLSKEVSALEFEAQLRTLPELIQFKAWVGYWASRPLPRKGLLAPRPEAPALLLNGSFVRMSDGQVWNQKPGRSDELHETGWT